MLPKTASRSRPATTRPGKRADAVVRSDHAPRARAAGVTPELRLTIQMVFAARRWRSLLDDRLRPLGHSAARMEAMSTIAKAPPGSAQIEIAKRIGVEGATLTRMLDSLEADGLVERIPHPTDRRTKHIRLTDAGRTALGEILAITNAMRTRLLDGIGGRSIDEANDFLAMILERLDDGLHEPVGDSADASSN
ncbi:MAG: slyA 3 [Sphingomonas bacterium]|nr:slyA 3 [Sphingomonas bacterium]MDB5717285.1 slyA 3 [Sphingomonas bacterium]